MDLRTAIAGLCLAGVGLSFGADAGSEPASVRMRCRTFPSDPGTEVDTRDASSELGRWVLGLEDQGWRLATVEFEIGPKPTGYAQGWTQVCLTPR